MRDENLNQNHNRNMLNIRQNNFKDQKVEKIMCLLTFFTL